MGFVKIIAPVIAPHGPGTNCHISMRPIVNLPST
jgi:hypothetical protein